MNYKKNLTKANNSMQQREKKLFSHCWDVLHNNDSNEENNAMALKYITERAKSSIYNLMAIIPNYETYFNIGL